MRFSSHNHHDMRRSLWLFVLLLMALNGYLLTHHRVLALFKAALALNTLAVIWFVANAFFPAKEKRRPRPVIQGILIVLFLLLNGITFMGTYTLYQMSRFPVVDMAGHAPGIHWRAFDGTDHLLSEFSGHAVVLHFWASWCVPCQQEFPKLIAYAGSHPDIEFIAFSVKDEREKAELAIARLGGSLTSGMPANLHYAWDPEATISYDTFAIQSFPSSIAIDSKGALQRKFIRSIEWDSKDIDNYLTSLSKP